MLSAAPSPDEIVELASESVLNSTGTWYKPVLRKLSVLCTKSFDADRIVGEESEEGEEGDNDKDRVALPSIAAFVAWIRLKTMKKPKKRASANHPWTVATALAAPIDGDKDLALVAEAARYALAWDAMVEDCEERTQRAQEAAEDAEVEHHAEAAQERAEMWSERRATLEEVQETQSELASAFLEGDLHEFVSLLDSHGFPCIGTEE